MFLRLSQFFVIAIFPHCSFLFPRPPQIPILIFNKFPAPRPCIGWTPVPDHFPSRCNRRGGVVRNDQGYSQVAGGGGRLCDFIGLPVFPKFRNSTLKCHFADTCSLASSTDFLFKSAAISFSENRLSSPSQWASSFSLRSVCNVQK